MNIYALIDRLIYISIKNNLIDEMDTIYTRNRLLSLFKEDSYMKNEDIKNIVNLMVEKN